MRKPRLKSTEPIVTPGAQTICEWDDGSEELFKVSDNRGHGYRLHLFKHATGWSMKVFDGVTRVAEAHCLPQGEALFLADLRVLDSAVHGIQGLTRVKGWFGFNVQGRIENYRNRGLGSALLGFVINQAGMRGFQRVTGKLAPIDLKENPGLPDWYQQRGFRVALAADQLAGTLELALG
jgi:GNAT superfamily N-acetyltransferase